MGVESECRLAIALSSSAACGTLVCRLVTVSGVLAVAGDFPAGTARAALGREAGRLVPGCHVNPTPAVASGISPGATGGLAVGRFEAEGRLALYHAFQLNIDSNSNKIVDKPAIVK